MYDEQNWSAKKTNIRIDKLINKSNKYMYIIYKSMFVPTCYFDILGDAPPYILYSCFLTNDAQSWCTNNIHPKLQCSASLLRDRAGLLYIWQYKAEMSPTSRPCSRFSEGLGKMSLAGTEL